MTLGSLSEDSLVYREPFISTFQQEMNYFSRKTTKRIHFFIFFQSPFNKNKQNNKNQNNFPNKKFKNADESRGVQRFKRVQEDKVEIDERVKDNSFDAKVSVLNPKIKNG